jgi:hypothetical protein
MSVLVWLGLAELEIWIWNIEFWFLNVYFLILNDEIWNWGHEIWNFNSEIWTSERLVLWNHILNLRNYESFEIINILKLENFETSQF